MAANFTLSKNSSSTFNTPFGKSNTLTLTSTLPPPDNAGHTWVSLFGEKSKNILLHLSFRRAHDRIVFNTNHNGTWGTETVVGLQAYIQSSNSVIITVTDKGQIYVVKIGDEEIRVPKAVGLEKEPVKSIEYKTDGVSFFSNPIVVNLA